MSSFYIWEFSEAYLGKNNDIYSYENTNNLYFKQYNTKELLNTNNYFEGYKIFDHNDIGFLDINSLITPDASFTLEFDVMEAGESIDISKSINYLTYGHHILGQRGVSITVGRNAGSSNVVIGMITENSVIKGLPIKERWYTEPNKVYRYTLTYDNFATNDNKIKLFRGANLISSSSNLPIQNMSFIDRTIFIGSSAWTNEPDWNSSFDVATNVVFTNVMKLYPNKVIDKSFIPGTPEYPLHVSYTNLTDTYRLDNQLIKSNDEIEIIFTCARDSPPSSVSVLIEASNNENTYIYSNASLISADTIPIGNGSNTVQFTYKFVATNEYPIDGILNYKLDFDGSVTPCNIEIPENALLYVDNTPPELEYIYSDPSDNNIGLTITAINDDYLTSMNKIGYFDYSITFFAKNDSETKFVTVKPPTLNQTYYIENLNSETFYDISADITDVAGNTSNGILPTNPSSLIETVDITTPTVNFVSSVSIKNEIHKAGIQLTLNTYDTACKNGNLYYYYMTTTSQQLSTNNDSIYDYVKNNYLFYETKSNFVQEANITHDIYEHFVNNVKYEILPETNYHIYMLAIDDASNISVQYKTHIVDNTITFGDITTDYSDPIIGQEANIITLNFSSDYYISTTQLNTSIVSSLTPTSTDGINWVLQRTILNSDPDGVLSYSVSQVPDIGSTTSSFNQTKKTIYLQNSAPSFKPNISLTSDVTNVYVNNIGNFINDFTVNNNNDLVKLSLTVDTQNYTNLYTNKSLIPNTFTFSNLLENKQYNVYGTLSNIFKQSSEYFIGSVSTTVDIPTISMDAGISNVDGNPTITLLDTSSVYEKTTNFDVYAIVTNFTMTDAVASAFFLDNPATKIGTNLTPNSDNQIINSICTKSNFNTYWDASLTENQIVVAYNNSEFNLYGMIYDQHNYAINSSTVSFDFSISTPVVSNLSFPYFIRHNDDVEMTWSSTFKTIASDYNVNMFNNFVVPTTTDNLNWVASITTPSTGDFLNTFQVVYLNNAIDIDKTGVFLDYSAPSYTLSNSKTSANSLEFKLVNIQDQFYTGGVLPSSIPNSFNFVISASNNSFYQEYTYNNLLYNDLSTLTYIVDNLIQNEMYIISSTITDQASNVRTIPYNNDGIVYTLDTELPIMTNTSANIFHVENTSNISLSNILAYDKHSDFDVYIGLFKNNTSTITSSIFLENSNSKAVVFKKNNTKRDIYASFFGTVDSFLDFDGSNWNTYPLEFNTTNYIYAMCIDKFNNINLNYQNVFATVIIGNGPIDTSEVVIDETETTNTGVTEESTSDVTFTETTTTTDATVEDDTVEFTETYEEIQLETTDTAVLEADIIEQTAADAGVSEEQVIVDSIESGSVIVNIIIRFKSTESAKRDEMKTRLESDYKNPFLLQKYKSSNRSNIRRSLRSFVDKITTTGYIGYDTSGNNNHLFINLLEGAINPLDSEGETDVQGTINLGNVSNIRFATSLQFNNTFTYSLEFKNNQSTFNDVILLQNDTSQLIKLTTQGILFSSGVEIVFPVEFKVRQFYTLTLTSEKGNISIYINGEEISSSSSIGTFKDPVGVLNIPQQANVFLRSIKIYSSPLSVENVVKLYTPSDKVIQLGFEEGYVFDYNVTFANNDFYFNNVKSPELELNKNGVYSFYQSPANNNVPLFFSYSNTNINDNTIQNFNIQYFSDDELLDNNIRYAAKFQSSIMNKIVIKADYDSLPNIFYYSSIENELLSKRITLSAIEPLIYNSADSSANAQPTYNVQPEYTSDTPVGEFAMVFDQQNKNSLEINNIYINPNTLTLSTWINYNNLAHNSNPIISQQNNFEFGITKNGKPYFKTL